MEARGLRSDGEPVGEPVGDRGVSSGLQHSPSSASAAAMDLDGLPYVLAAAGWSCVCELPRGLTGPMAGGRREPGTPGGWELGLGKLKMGVDCHLFST